MAINGIEITYRQVSEGSSGNGVDGRSNQKTSVINQFSKGNATSNSLGILKKTTGFKVSNALKAGAIGIAINEGVKFVTKVADIGLQIYGAKTGEMMKIHNIKADLQVAGNFGGMMKKALWDNGYLRNLELARENQALQNERDLSGKIILQKQYQKSLL